MLRFRSLCQKEEANGLYAVMTQNDAAPAALLAGKASTKANLDEEQTELTFISDRDDADAKQPKFKVYLWSRNGNAVLLKAQIAITRARPSLTPLRSFQLHPCFAKILWSATRPRSAFHSTAAGCFWAPRHRQTRKRVRTKNSCRRKGAGRSVALEKILRSANPEGPAEQERSRSFRPSIRQRQKFVQLANEAMESVSPSNDGRYAIGVDNRAYRIMSDYDPGLSDYYLVNTDDGLASLWDRSSDSEQHFHPAQNTQFL